MGEAELKVEELVNEVFNKYNPKTINDEEVLTKDDIKMFLKDLMEKAGESDAWCEKEFESCYKEFDYDGNGTITRDELT